MKIFDFIHLEMIKWGTLFTKYPVGRATAYLSVIQSLIVATQIKMILFLILSVSKIFWAKYFVFIIFFTFILFFYLNTKRYSSIDYKKINTKSVMRSITEFILFSIVGFFFLIILVR